MSAMSSMSACEANGEDGEGRQGRERERGGEHRCAKRRRDSPANNDAKREGPRKRRKEQERRKEESCDSHEICPLYPDYHDHEGHFNYVLGESVGATLDEKEPSRRRYKLLDKVGQGTFGRVFTCWDRVERCYVAVKVVKAMKKYTHSAKFEIDILKKIHSPDTPKEPLPSEARQPLQHCINLLDSFLFKGHMCLVFPHCGLSLYDFMKRNDFKPFEMQIIKDIARNLFEALYYLHDNLNIIHTDLKPENVLFKSSETRKEQCDVDTDRDSRSREDSPTRSRSRSASSRASRRSKSRCRQYYVPRSTHIKVIDLGSAIFESDHHSSVISTRHYRAPEVVLHLGWSYPADIWSVGMKEDQKALVQACEHLAMMEYTLGSFPASFIAKASSSKESLILKNSTIEKYFHRLSGDQFEVSYQRDSKAKRRWKEVRSLENLVDPDLYPHFYELIKQTLLYDPNQRITAQQALQLPFFKTNQSNSQNMKFIK